MKRVLVVAMGIALGTMLAGPVVAFSLWLPDPLRNEYVVWSVAALVVGASVRVTWTILGPRRE